MFHRFHHRFGRSASMIGVLGLFGLIGFLSVNLAATSTAAAPMAPTVTTAAQDDEVETFDRIRLANGLVLEGKIIEERRTEIVFRIVDPAIGIAVERTIDRHDIVEIERNIERVVEREDDVEDRREVRDDEDETSGPRARGLGEGDADDESLPAFFVLPMRGQMGTDVHPEPYRRVMEDINRVRPDVVVWVINGQDMSQFEHRLAGDDSVLEGTGDPERSLEFLLSDYRELVRMLQDDISPDIRQVVWVEDSYGMSTMIALAWEEVYMKPRARLGGIRRLIVPREQLQDEDVREKMISATIGMVAGLLERNMNLVQYANILAEAMCRPERQLSASWRGREVIWRLDTRGEYVVNSSKELPAEFRAKHAEDFGISKGTAESLDDLALLLGYREYRVLEGESHRVISRHVDGWRREWRNTQRWFREYQEARRWAQGDQAAQWLGQAADRIRRIISAMRNYPAVEVRFRMQYGGSRFDLEMLEQSLRDEIQRIRRGGGGRPGGGGGRGGGGGGPRPG
jgi:hypothetical protein